MCGIVGYVGSGCAATFLIDALEKLEYRGYDSAGVAVFTNGKMNLLKKKGRINVLKEALGNFENFEGKVGIGHTRWATHGAPSDLNAHPHVCGSRKIAIVHNGIIENYKILKKDLKSKGFEFSSETDTEVACAIIDHFYSEEKDIFKAIKKSVKVLKGSFALGILCEDYANQIIALKKESPLIIGFTDTEKYIASDVSAFIDKTKNICRLNECEIAVISAEDVKYYNFEGEVIEKNTSVVSWNFGSSTKEGFEHYMIKEIMEQPAAVKRTIEKKIKKNEISFNEIEGFNEDYIKTIKKIQMVACGSAYHVCVVAKYMLESISKIPVEIDFASEFRYRDHMISKNTLVIFVSQSGETADTLASLRKIKKLKIKTMAIVNVPGSSIAMEADFVFYTLAGIEIAVATTKAYSAQLSCVYMLALKIAKIKKSISDKKYNEYIEYLKKIPVLISKICKNKDEYFKIAKKYHLYEDVFFMGRGIDYAVALEGSLKFKEVSYIHSEAYVAGELKHGPISLIENNVLVFAVACNQRLLEKTVSNIREVMARGAKCIILTTESNKGEFLDITDEEICIPQIPELMLPSLAIIPLQFISYYTALMRERDIDKPRNLAKSVTVE